MSRVVYQTDLSGLNLMSRGKVRDIYDLGDSLLIVATDRISAFDVVLPNGIPCKGKVLTKISLFWFEFLKDIVDNHLITADVKQFPDAVKNHAGELEGRSMIVKKAIPFPVECVVRGYLSGSGWSEYTDSGSVCGILLPRGLKNADKLPEPIFTPATKEEVGKHDVNITFDEMVGITGLEVASKLREHSVSLYRKAAEFALARGVIIADTKFEFGLFRDKIILIDEVLTPDSSRFWPAEQYSPGGSQESFDKQFVRNYLLTLDWDRRAPGPKLPKDVIKGTTERYREALRVLTGEDI